MAFGKKAVSQKTKGLFTYMNTASKSNFAMLRKLFFVLRFGSL